MKLLCALVSIAAVLHLSHATNRVKLSTSQDASQEKVSVDFYEESLCPFCAKFTTDIAAPLFKNGLSDYIEFRLIPYGNAKNTSEGLQCQHGDAECRVNRIFACAIDQGREQDVWFPFINCVEGHFGADIESSVESCAQDAKLDYQDIKGCATGSLGDELEQAAADETDSLVPKHQYVPWVVVNGVPLLDDYANLQTYICVALNQNTRPDACLSSTRKSNRGLSKSSSRSWQGAVSSVLSSIMGWF